MVVPKCLRCEDVPLKPLQELLLQDQWNPLNRLLMSSWLSELRDEEDKERRTQCGNLVVPLSLQATYAWNILLQLAQRNDSPLVSP